jgi:hypothetical protein
MVPILRLCVLYGSQNKQQRLPYKTLRVFTARYALSPYLKQIRFVFKGLISFKFEITRLRSLKNYTSYIYLFIDARICQ